jgi:hypothetical protein
MNELILDRDKIHEIGAHYVLFFKTESQRNNRVYYVKSFSDIEEALFYRNELIHWGYNGKKVIKTALKEGSI